jgi:hypothetical protein
MLNPGSGAFLTSGSGMGKKSRSGSGMNKPDHISESLKTIFWVKIHKFFKADPGSGMVKNRKFEASGLYGTGKFILDPEHWQELTREYKELGECSLVGVGEGAPHPVPGPQVGHTHPGFQHNATKISTCLNIVGKF